MKSEAEVKLAVEGTELLYGLPKKKKKREKKIFLLLPLSEFLKAKFRFPLLYRLLPEVQDVRVLLLDLGGAVALDHVVFDDGLQVIGVLFGGCFPALDQASGSIQVFRVDS